MAGIEGSGALGAASPARVSTARGPIECAVTGDGPTFVALHGGMGGHDQSALLARALLGEASGHRVLAVSRPGYLGTPLEVGRTPEEQADAIAALLDAMGIDRAVVAAVSAGGPSALQFAHRHAGRCRALILVSACTGKLETPPEILSRLGFMRKLAAIPGIAALLRWRVERRPERAASRAIADPVLRANTMRDPVAGPLLRALQTSVFGDLARRLPGTANDIRTFQALGPMPFDDITVPLLVLHGTADRIVPFTHADAVALAAPRAELVAIAGGEHVALFTHLELARAKVHAFLADDDRGRGTFAQVAI